MHGTFWESRGLSNGLTLAFDRTLLIAPVQANSKYVTY